MWKLLGALLPAELKFECERAAIPPSNISSHNSVKLAKYIMTNGYDPETFYFNILYHADKTSNLMGMVANSGTLGACQRSSSSRANVTSGNSVNASASTKINSPPSPLLPLNSSAGEKQTGTTGSTWVMTGPMIDHLCQPYPHGTVLSQFPQLQL